MDSQNLIIVCPHCKEKISIEEALSHQVAAKISAKAREEIRHEMIKEIKSLEEENKNKEREIEEMQKVELELRKEKNRLGEERRKFELEKQRQLDEEREKIRQEALKEQLEKQRFKEAEKDKVINDLKKALEEAQVKASQGSQQAQGEVQELDLEEELMKTFPTDLIEPIKKGERGADVRQIVKTRMGNVCGVILWESKRTKAWKDEFISKLKDDLRAEKANVPIIVTTIMPKESQNGLYYKEGVWICTFYLATVLAELIRQKLIEVARQRFVSQSRGTKADEIYEYVTGHEFRQQIEAAIEVYSDMKNELSRERNAFEKIWKTRDEQINRLFKSTARIVGAIGGKVGSEFPQPKGLDLLEEGNK